MTDSLSSIIIIYDDWCSRLLSVSDNSRQWKLILETKPSFNFQSSDIRFTGLFELISDSINHWLLVHDKWIISFLCCLICVPDEIVKTQILFLLVSMLFQAEIQNFFWKVFSNKFMNMIQCYSSSNVPCISPRLQNGVYPPLFVRLTLRTRSSDCLIVWSLCSWRA